VVVRGIVRDQKYLSHQPYRSHSSLLVPSEESVGKPVSWKGRRETNPNSGPKVEGGGGVGELVLVVVVAVVVVCFHLLICRYE